MTNLDDPCQGILLEQPTQIDLSRKLQILDEVLQEHGITAVSLLYVMKRKLISEHIIHHNILCGPSMMDYPETSGRFPTGLP